MISKTRCRPLGHAQLGAGAGNSGKLVLQVCAAALRIAALIGGMHLLHANNERLVDARAALRTYDPARIISSHCTGEAAVHDLQAAFPGRITTGYSVLRYAANTRKRT